MQQVPRRWAQVYSRPRNGRMGRDRQSDLPGQGRVIPIKRTGVRPTCVERICGAGSTTPFAANGVPPSPNADCKINGVSDSSTIPTQVAAANYRYARDGKMYADFASQFAALTSNLTAGKFGITSITSYYHFKQTDLNNVSGEAYPATFSQLADFEQFAEEVRFQSKYEGPFNVLFGAFYSKGDFDFNTDAYIFPVPLDPGTGTYTTFKRDNGFSRASSISVIRRGAPLNLVD
jgi:iron complex outermembrane receptor protein